jgi:glycosyltransferase involved in cell wall biosynthesis
MLIKILHVIPTLSSGGAERQLVDVVCNTSKEDFSHTVCFFSKPDFFAPVIRGKGHKVINLNLDGKRPWFAAARKIKKIVESVEPDIIHSWLYDANMAARLAVLIGKKIPLITSLQATDYEAETIRSNDLSPRKVNVLRLIDKTLAKMTNPYYAACSDFVAKSYQKNIAARAARMRVIFNSVDPKILAAEPDEPQKIRRKLKIPDDAFVYINVGRLDAQKGQTFLLRAFQKTLPEVPNAYLVIVGAGGLENVLKELAQSIGVKDRVVFAGRQKNIGAWLEMADVFVFPSNFEGLPLALLEAMAKKLPCIVSDIEVHREVVEDKISALLIAPQSETALAQAMIQIYKQPELCAQLGQAAFQKVENHFFSRLLMPEWEKLYADVSANL